MKTVTIPKEEYERFKEAYAILRDEKFLDKLNRLAELILFERLGIVMPENTSDLTEAAIGRVAEWKSEGNPWDDV
ncbi:MAG: hypothetical protein ACE5IY_15785 [bacterium]